MSIPAPIIRASVAEVPALQGSPLAIIGLGANLAAEESPPLGTLQLALESLASLSKGPVLVSSWWETDPLDCPPGSPRFINGVAVFSPQDVSPHRLLRDLQRIEERFGRVRSGTRNAARTLDLDVLCVGDTQCSDEILTLPHPRMHTRRFVLVPLLEVLPDFVIPGFSLSVRKLLELTENQGRISRINKESAL